MTSAGSASAATDDANADADEGVGGEDADEGVDDDNDAESRAAYGAPLVKDTRVKDLPRKDSDKE